MRSFNNNRSARRPVFLMAGFFLISLFLSAALPDRSSAGFLDWVFPAKKEAPVEKGQGPYAPGQKAPEKTPLPRSFTIEGIESLPEKPGVVKLTFTAACYADNLKDKLRIFPPVQIDWYNSQFRDEVLLLKGQFSPGQEYHINIPEGVECKGHKYIRTKNTFRMPDLGSSVQLADPDTVIERDSRQMLHVKVTNAEELLFEGLKISPLLVPQVLKTHARSGTAGQAGPQEAAAPAAQPAGAGAVRAGSDINVPFSRVREFIEKRYEQLRRLPDAEQELGYFLDAPSEDRQLFFPGKTRNRTQDFSVPLNFRKDRERGAVEVIQLTSTRKDEKAATPVRVYRITDLGITYKLSRGSLLLWVTSLNSGKPVPGVAVVAVLRDSDMMPLGKTDDKGVLYVKGSHKRVRYSLSQNKKLDPSPVPVRDIEYIAAGSPSDSTYIEISEGGNIRPDWIKQASSVNDRASLSKGRVFTERGIYRPGERVFFKGAIREYREGSIRPPSKGNPKVTVTDSKGEEIYAKEIPLSEFGTLNGSLDIKPFFPLGAYTIRMKHSDGQKPAGSEALPPSGADPDEEEWAGPGGIPAAQEGEAVATFEVQEFSAPRHFVELSFRKERKTDESYVNLQREIDLLVCNITGIYYAGGPVKNGKVRWKATYRGTDFKVREYRDYTFGSVIEEPVGLIESGESMLDEKGTLSVTIPLGKEVAAGLYSVEVSATVVDFDGKASTNTSSFQEEPDYKVGLSSHEPSVRSGDMQVVKAIVVDREGRRIQQGDLKVDVLREDWIYVRKRNEQGAIFWEDKRAYRKDHSSAIKIRNSEAVFDFDFANGGTYLIRFTYRGADGREYSSGTSYTVEGHYYRYGYKDRQRNFERLVVSTEKKEYSPGETIKVLIYPQKPLSSVLMTIERRGILEYRSLGPVNGKKYVDIAVAKRHEPNIYISFLGIISRKDFPAYSAQFDDKAPDFLFGVVNAEVKGEPGGLSVRINEEEPELKYEPGSDVSLRVFSADKTGKGVETEVALCVVDESVLALTGFSTPVLDELSRFSSPLSVFTGELRTELLKQTPYGYIRNERLTGGDGGGGGREVPLSKLRKDFRPVAYFNPALKTGRDGHAEVSFTIPDSMTNYRVYAVACDRKSGFASSGRGLLAVKDFYIEPGTPRFFTGGDSFRFFVSAFNKTKEDGTGRFSIGRDELLRMSAPEGGFQLRAMDRTLIPVKGEAGRPGTASLSFGAEFGAFKDSVEIKVPVRSGHVLWNDVVFGNARGKTDVTYTFPEYLSRMDWKGLHPDDVKVMLTVTGSPFIKMSKGLRYLLRYPYGCIEQTSSGVMPLAALRALIKDGLIADITTTETDKFLKPGIERLLSMQTSSGGFAYWPGNVNPDMWGTVYAVSALTRAREAGLEVPADRMSGAIAYLRNTLKEQTSRDDTFRGYALYLLAANNQLDAQVFRDVYKNIGSMPREAALMTLLAARTSGLIQEKELVDKTRDTAGRQRERGAVYSFHALYREPAIALLASTAILKDEATSGRIARELLAGMTREGIWTSTSDTGWSLVALAEYFKGSGFSLKPVRVTLRQEGWPETSLSVDPRQSYSYPLESAAFLKTPSVTITTDQGAELTYMLSLTFPRTDLAKEGYSKGFRVHKTIENMDGSKDVRVGDVVRVKIDIETEEQMSRYIVLDDPLPAGLVAINSAIRTEEVVQDAAARDSDAQWSDWDPETGSYRFTPNHFEMRDDRVLAFKDRAWKGRYQYSYYARAVCEGSFVMPPSKVQLMYEPQMASFTPMGKFVILERSDKAR